MIIANRSLERAQRAGGGVQRLRDHAGRDARAPARGRHRREHRPRRPRPSSREHMTRAALQGTQAQADVHGRHRRAARHRCRGIELEDVYLFTVDDLQNVVKREPREAGVRPRGRRQADRGRGRAVRAAAAHARRRAADPPAARRRGTHVKRRRWSRRNRCSRTGKSAADAQGPARRAQHLPRDPRRHRRRRGGDLRRRPVPHVLALCRSARLEGRGPRRATASTAATRRSSAASSAAAPTRPEVRIRHAPRAARAGHRGAGPHPHLGLHRGDPAGTG
jgi:hypothetical protein